MTRSSVWIQQEIEGGSYMFIVPMSKMLRPLFLDGDQFEEPFNHRICKYQPALNFVPLNANNRNR